MVEWFLSVRDKCCLFCSFRSLKKKLTKVHAMQMKKISETVNRVVSKTVNVSLIYRFLHRFQVKKHVIVLPSKLLSLKLRVIYLMELAFKTRSLKDRKLELNWWQLSWRISLIRFKQFWHRAILKQQRVLKTSTMP